MKIFSEYDDNQRSESSVHEMSSTSSKLNRSKLSESSLYNLDSFFHQLEISKPCSNENINRANDNTNITTSIAQESPKIESKTGDSRCEKFGEKINESLLKESEAIKTPMNHSDNESCIDELNVNNTFVGCRLRKEVEKLSEIPESPMSNNTNNISKSTDRIIDSEVSDTSRNLNHSLSNIEIKVRR